MQFVNSIIQVIRKFSSALWLTLSQMLEAMTSLAVKTAKLAFQFARYIITVIYRTYGVCREYIILLFIRIARFLTSIWQLYILIFVFVLLGFLLKHFFGTPGVIATFAFASLLIVGAVYNIIKNNTANDESDDIGAWDSFAKTDLAKYSFNGVIFVGLAVSAFWFKDALPQPPHLQYVKSYFSKPTALDGYAEKCEANDLNACTYLGILARNGEGMKVDLDLALALLTKACDGGTAKGCAALADMFDKGLGVKQDRRRATALYQTACTGGDLLGCSNLGVSKLRGYGTTPSDAFAAVNLWIKACDGNVAVACYNLAFQRVSGIGTKRDLGSSARLFEKGCELRDAQSCFQSGSQFLDGIGVWRNEAKAFAQFKMACDSDVGLGCSSLGFMYSKGRGTVADAKRASELYAKACDLGTANGCSNLAVLTETGRGVARDLKRAEDLYGKACKGGYQPACASQKILAKRNAG